MKEAASVAGLFHSARHALRSPFHTPAPPAQTSSENEEAIATATSYPAGTNKENERQRRRMKKRAMQAVASHKARKRTTIS